MVVLGATYVGEDRELYMKTALVTEEGGKLLAQFDDLSLDSGDGTGKCYNWHEFDPKEFALNLTPMEVCSYLRIPRYFRLMKLFAVYGGARR
jgi:hypothetical protein